MLQLQSVFGIFSALLAIAFAISERRSAVSWKQAAIGLLVTLATAVVLLKIPYAAKLFAGINDAVGTIANATRAGTAFVFGYVGGGPLPFEVKPPAPTSYCAFQALPLILVMSVLTTLLFYWRILPPIVRGLPSMLERTMKVGGAVGLSAAANIFLGMVEAPLFIKPYLAKLTRGELFLVMTGGMAGIAGTVMVLYSMVLGPHDPGASAHFVDRLGAGRAGGDRDRADHGAGRATRNRGRPGDAAARPASSTMDAIVQGTTDGIAAAAQRRRDAARAGRAGASGERSARPVARRRRRAGLAAARARRRDGAGLLADGHSVGRPPLPAPDGHQDDPERVHRLSRILRRCRPKRSASARASSCSTRCAASPISAARHHDRRVDDHGARTRGHRRARLKSIVSGTLATCLMGAIVGVLN